MNQLLKHLKLLVQLLEEERQALIRNDGNKIGNIVNKKNEILNQLGKLEEKDMEKSQETMILFDKIQDLQEINLLLTKQALSYNNALLEGISENMKNASNTYSAKGNYESQNNINLIDQSV